MSESLDLAGTSLGACEVISLYLAISRSLPQLDFTTTRSTKT